MLVVFIRHATAEEAGPSGDASRALTDKGRKEAKAVAKALKRLGVPISAVLSSPLVRAKQTADALAKSFKAEVELAEFLAPPADVQQIRQRLRELMEAKVEGVVLVGHAPSLDEVVGQFVAGTSRTAGRTAISLTKAGAACFEIPSDRPADAELLWIMQKGQLSMISDL